MQGSGSGFSTRGREDDRTNEEKQAAQIEASRSERELIERRKVQQNQSNAEPRWNENDNRSNLNSGDNRRPDNNYGNRGDNRRDYDQYGQGQGQQMQNNFDSRNNNQNINQNQNQGGFDRRGTQNMSQMGQGFDRRDNMGMGMGNRQGGYQNHQDDRDRSDRGNDRQYDNRDRFDRMERFERGQTLDTRDNRDKDYNTGRFDQEGPIQRNQYQPPLQRDFDDRNRDRENRGDYEEEVMHVPHRKEVAIYQTLLRRRVLYLYL